jgi:transposase
LVPCRLGATGGNPLNWPDSSVRFYPLADWTIEIVKRSDVAKGVVLLPRRWVVERTLAWLNRNRRLAKDVEATIESAVTWLYIAGVKLMSRRLAAT